MWIYMSGPVTAHENVPLNSQDVRFFQFIHFFPILFSIVIFVGMCLGGCHFCVYVLGETSIGELSKIT